MSTKEQRQQHHDNELQRGEAVKALIQQQVLHTLGSPQGLQTVQVRHLWEACYRVNVLVGVDIATVRIASSYFVEVDDDGVIVGSTPTITKQP
jgi:hypothetical protein